MLLSACFVYCSCDFLNFSGQKEKKKEKGTNMDVYFSRNLGQYSEFSCDPMMNGKLRLQDCEAFFCKLETYLPLLRLQDGHVQRIKDAYF